SRWYSTMLAARSSNAKQSRPLPVMCPLLIASSTLRIRDTAKFRSSVVFSRLAARRRICSVLGEGRGRRLFMADLLESDGILVLHSAREIGGRLTIFIPLTVLLMGRHLAEGNVRWTN